MQSQIKVFLKWLLRSCRQEFIEKEFNLKKVSKQLKAVQLKGSVTMAQNWNNILQKSNEI